jgi:anti-sigma B factor antagonist
MDGVNDQFDIDASSPGPDRHLLVVRGEIEFRTAPLLRRAIDAARDDAVNHVTIDLAGVTFIDSSGLAVLVDASAATNIVLRHPSPAVERIIALTGLTSTLQIEHV